VDVRDDEEVKSWISEAVAEFGKLDGAANVAGVAAAPDGGSTVETMVRIPYYIFTSASLRVF
jgi:NAD(P)-dependent dehydrogenase (short-subunit alcohol dehydrogenase family)